MNLKMEKHKMIQQIQRSGTSYVFERLGLNKYNERDLELPNERFELFGVFHEVSDHLNVQMSDEVRFRTKKIPSIMCLWEDAQVVRVDDLVVINTRTYKVNGVINLNEWNIVADISLEVIDDGTI